MNLVCNMTESVCAPRAFHRLWKGLVLLLALVGSKALAGEPTGPKAVFTEKAFTFGEVEQGTAVVHSFRVLNEGNQVLRIHRVRPG